MTNSHRRDFVKAGVVGLGAAALVGQNTLASSAQQDSIRIAQIGCGGQGSSLASRFKGIAGVEVAFVCDPDQKRREKLASDLGGKTQPVDDLRRILDDKSIDAVVVATPDHWHVPASLLALDAGKHVYVEKPCSHNVLEGRLLVNAARKQKLHVQHGTHSRSIPLIAGAIQALREKVIGDVIVAKAWNVQRRGQIGMAKPSDPPNGFDYDMWLGPAPQVPFQKNRFHYTWHWWYDFGTGDTGNDGVHEIDIARWGLGVETHPSSVSAVGGKYVFNDDQQFPDTQYVSFDYPGDGDAGQRRQLVFEMRLWSKYGLEGVDNGNAFYGSEGWMLLSKRGIAKVFDQENREREIKLPRLELPNHTQNFVDAIRENGKLAAEIEVGHLSSTLCHLANISTRLGRSVRFDPAREQIEGDDEAAALLSRKYRENHWAVPNQA